jgi:hypothetical protein
MRATPYISRTARCVGQDCVEHVPVSVNVVVAYIVVCVSIATRVNVASITNVEIGAQASVSLYALLLLALLSTRLTLTGLARLTWLQGLVGLTTPLATSTA